MLGTRHDDDAIAGDRLLHQVFRFDPAFDETDIGSAVLHRFGDLHAVAGGKLDFHAGMILAEAHKMLRQPVARNRLARMDRQRAALETAQFGKRHFRRAGTGENGARFIEETGGLRRSVRCRGRRG